MSRTTIASMSERETILHRNRAFAPLGLPLETVPSAGRSGVSGAGSLSLDGVSTGGAGSTGGSGVSFGSGGVSPLSSANFAWRRRSVSTPLEPSRAKLTNCDGLPVAGKTSSQPLPAGSIMKNRLPSMLRIRGVSPGFRVTSGLTGCSPELRRRRASSSCTTNPSSARGSMSLLASRSNHPQRVHANERPPIW